MRGVALVGALDVGPAEAVAEQARDGRAVGGGGGAEGHLREQAGAGLRGEVAGLGVLFLRGLQGGVEGVCPFLQPVEHGVGEQAPPLAARQGVSGVGDVERRGALVARRQHEARRVVCRRQVAAGRVSIPCAGVGVVGRIRLCAAGDSRRLRAASRVLPAGGSGDRVPPRGPALRTGRGPVQGRRPGDRDARGRHRRAGRRDLPVSRVRGQPSRAGSTRWPCGATP